MAVGASAGTAYLQVLPDTSQLAPTLRRDLRQASRTPAMRKGVPVPVVPDTDRFAPMLKREIRQATPRRGVEVPITPDVRNFGRNLHRGVMPGVKNLALSAAGALGAAFAGAAVIGGLKSIIGAASDLNEVISKTDQVFGKNAKEIQQWARGSARGFGLSRKEALDSASAFGNMFLQLKIGRRPAQDMSTSMVELAADLASFHNADITQVLEAQQAAFRGEYDSVQRFIPTLQAATVEQEALRQTHKSSAKDLTASEKATAAYSLMMKGAGKATGDFARTSEGAANQQRILKAETDNLKASLGQALLPAFTSLLKTLNERVIPAVRELWQTHGPKLRELWEDLATTVQTFYEGVRDNLEPQLARIKTAWEENKTAILGFTDAITDADDASTSGADAVHSFGDAMVAIITTAGQVSSAMQTAEGYINGFNKTVQDVGHWIHQRFTVPIVKAFGDVVGAFLTGNHKMIAGAATVAEALHLPMAGSLRKAEQAMGGFVKDFNSKLNDLDDETANITAKFGWQGLEVFRVGPKGQTRLAFAEGGQLPGYGGGDTVPIMAEPGEAIVPKHLARRSEFRAWAGSRGIPGFARGGIVADLDPPPMGQLAGKLGTFQNNIGRVLDLATTAFKNTVAALGGGPGIQGALSWARSQVGKPYLWGGVGPGGYDCSGFMSAIANVVMGRRPYNRLFATGSFPTSGWSAGFVPWGFNIGSRRGSPGHMAGTLGGVNVESSGSVGVRVGGGARGARDSLFGGNIWHLTGRSGASPGSHERFIGFDQGGWLQPGPTLALNNTGRPEPVGFDYDELAAAIARNPPQVFLDRVRVSHELRTGEQWNAYRR